MAKLPDISRWRVWGDGCKILWGLEFDSSPGAKEGGYLFNN